MKRALLALPLAASFAVPVSYGQSAPTATMGKTAYAQCVACHSMKPGVNGVGPSLAGVAGRRVANVPGFNYSPAMRAKNGTWTDRDLDAFLRNPRAAVPNNRMPFAGVPDANKRAALIAYLKNPG